MNKKIISTTTAILSLGFLVSTVFAAPGDQVAPPGPVVPDNTCGEFNGVGVAFDGTNILFTCANEASIRKTDTAGTDLGSLPTADAAGNPVFLDAIVWDKANNEIWGGDVDGQNSMCRVWSVDANTGTATHEFSFADTTGNGHCSVTFFDGITIDPSDDTLWVSPDIHPEIYHYQKDGTQLAADTIDFESITPGGCAFNAGAGCWNSGLAMGLDGNLFAGTDGEGKIYQVDPTAGGSKLGLFSTVTGRDEDLECGPLVGGYETVLSRDFETGQIDVLEAPEGTCVITEVSLDPTFEVNDLNDGNEHTVTAKVTANGQPLPGVLVSFYLTVGPSSIQQSDPGECSTDPNCRTDAVGQTSWTYANPDGTGVDQIAACYVTAGGTRHCAFARKEWVDQTPPLTMCTETVNPHGQTTPPAGSTTLPGPKGGQNEDGFYELQAEDADPNVQMFVTDSESGTVFGPFKPGTKVKYTEANGAKPNAKPIGNSNGQADAIAWHITGTGDMLVSAVDGAGNVSKVSCLVPPPPK